MERKNKCPHCGAETIPQEWYGVNPLNCNKCGKPAWKKSPEITYK